MVAQPPFPLCDELLALLFARLNAWRPSGLVASSSINLTHSVTTKGTIILEQMARGRRYVDMEVFGL